MFNHVHGSMRSGASRRKPVAALAAALAFASAFVVGQPLVAPQSLPGADAVTSTSSNGELQLDYTASTHSLPSGGGSVTYTYVVTNKSKVTYYGSTLTADKSYSSYMSDSACSPITLKSGSNTIPAGGSATYTCTTTLTKSTSSTVNLHFASRPGAPTVFTDVSAQEYVQVGGGTTAAGSTTTMAKIDCTVPKIWDMATVDGSDNPVTDQNQTTYGSTLHQQYQTPTQSLFQPINFNATTPWSWNALSYNTSDQLLYGITNNDRGGDPGHLIQIDANGQIKDLGLIGASTGWRFQVPSGWTQNPQTNWEADIQGGINTGVFGADGAYYVSNGSTSGLQVLYRIDIATKTVTQVTTGGTKLVTNDFTLMGGALWGIDNTTSTMYRIVTNGTSQATVKTFDISALGIPTGIYGAAWTYGNGNLGFDNNSTGGVYQIQVTNPLGTAPSFTLVSVGPGESSYNNDGASCATAPADLALVKSAPATVLVGGTVKFTLRVSNVGTTYSSGGYVTDTVPAGYTAITPDSAFAKSCTVTGNKLACFTGQLNPGDSYDITFTAKAPTTVGTCLTNTATILGNEADGTSANNTGSEQTCTTNARIDIVKTASSVAVSGPDANGVFTGSYTVKVTNNGTTAGSYTQITDTPAFGSAYTVKSVTWAGGPANAAATAAASNSAGGYLVGTSAAKTLAAGATDTYTVSVTYTEDSSTFYTATSSTCAVAPADQTGTGLFNRVSLPEENADSTANSTCLNPAPVLELKKQLTRSATGDVAQVSASQGGNAAVSASTGANGTTADSGQTSVVAGTAYTLADTMTTGSIADYAAQLSCTNADADSTTVLPSGSVTSASITLAATDNVTCTFTNTPKPKPAINVAKTVNSVSTAAADGDQTVTYALTATNSGAAAGSYGPIMDTPAFAANLAITKVEWRASGDAAWTTATGSAPYAVGSSHSLAAGATDNYLVRITFHATTAAATAADTCQATPAAGQGLFNSVTATGETGSTSDNAACASVTPPTSGLTMTKSVKSVTDVNGNGYHDAGDQVNYTFHVTNTGSVTLAPVTVTDELLGLDGMPCTASLAPGASADCDATVAHTITAADVTAGDVHNSATATGVPPNSPSVTTPPSTTDTPVAPTGSAVVSKVDAGSGASLDGAVFSLYTTTANTWDGTTMAPSATVCRAATATGTTPVRTGLTATGGSLSISPLKLSNYDYTTYQSTTSGSYTVYCLVETKAPAGHNLSAAPTVFTVSSTTAAQVTVKDTVQNLGNALPQTGGRGATAVAGLGLVLLAGAAALVLGRGARPAD